MVAIGVIVEFVEFNAFFDGFHLTFLIGPFAVRVFVDVAEFDFFHILDLLYLSYIYIISYLFRNVNAYFKFFR